MHKNLHETFKLKCQKMAEAASGSQSCRSIKTQLNDLKKSIESMFNFDEKILVLRSAPLVGKKD